MSVLAPSAGVPGANGAQGPAGAPGATGPAGQIQLVTCTTVTKTVKRHKRKQKHCTTKLVSGPVSFATGASVHATLSRNRHVYATGTVRWVRGHEQLVLGEPRPLPRGGYTLILRRLQGSRWSMTGQQITIG